MVDKPEVFLINCTEDGIRCEVVRRENFSKWFAERTEGVKPENRPVFVKHFPSYNSAENEYLIIEGKVLIPKPITMIETCTLEET